MTQSTFTIDSIAGNSFIGVPVFSRFGQMQNYNYIVMSPQKKVKEKENTELHLIDKENERFKLMRLEVAALNNEDGQPRRESKSVLAGGPTHKKLGDGAKRTGTAPIQGSAVNESVPFERRQFLSQMMNDLDKKVEQVK